MQKEGPLYFGLTVIYCISNTFIKSDLILKVLCISLWKPPTVENGLWQILQYEFSHV